MSCFVICPQCSRHVRSAEPVCPFCNGTLVGAQCHAPSAATSGGVVHRAFVFAAAAASVGAACSMTSSPEPLYGPVGWTDASTGTGGSSQGSGGASGAGGSSVAGGAGAGGAGGAPSEAGADASSEGDANDGGTASDGAE